MIEPNLEFLLATQKGYRNMIFTHQIYVSRDVVFHESIFPYQDLLNSRPKNSISINLIHDDGTIDYTTPSLNPTSISSSDSMSHNPVENSSDSHPISTDTPSTFPLMALSPQLDNSCDSPTPS